MSQYITNSQYALIVFLVVIVFLILYFSLLKSRPQSLLGIVLVLLGGGINLIARYKNQCVEDNISLAFIHVNIADIMITLGLLIVVFVFIIDRGSR